MDIRVILILRVAPAISFMVLLTLTSRWNEIICSIHELKLPRVFTLILLATYRYIFTLLDFISKMLLSRKSRIVGALFMKSYSLNERNISCNGIYRGFSGEIKSIRSAELNPRSFIFLLICVVTSITLIIADHAL